MCKVVKQKLQSLIYTVNKRLDPQHKQADYTDLNDKYFYSGSDILPDKQTNSVLTSCPETTILERKTRFLPGHKTKSSSSLVWTHLVGSVMIDCIMEQQDEEGVHYISDENMFPLS